MEIYRLSSCNFIEDLTGEGARIYGGRWNSVGVPAIYFANSRALSVLEVLVHLPPNYLPENFCIATFEWNISITEIKVKELPIDWNLFPYPKMVQVFGDNLLKNSKSALIKIPSSIVEGEFNFILNPKHQDAKNMIKKGSESFSFDKRLF